MAETGRKEKDLPIVEDFTYVRGIDRDGRSANIPKSLFGGNLDVASENVLGGVKASPREAADTNEVKIDPNTGKLYCPPSEVSVATSTKVGGIVAEPKTNEETQEVKIDPQTGKAYVKPSIGGGGDVTGVKGNAESSYRKGDVNITPSNIGLGNVNNTADSDKSVKYATSSGSATKATQDANGNVISETYATKTEMSNAESVANEANEKADSAEASSDEALNIANEAKAVANTAKNAVATLEGLANTTTAQETLAQQVLLLEELKSGLTDIIYERTYTPSVASTRIPLTSPLKAGNTYTVYISYKSPTGKFVNLKANNSNSGTAVDTLLSGIYKNSGSHTLEYTPTVDITYWYVDFASDYAATDTTSVTITASAKETVRELRERVSVINEELEAVQAQVEELTSGIGLLIDKNYNPSQQVSRYDMGTVLKAGKTYTVEFNYTIGTGRFVGLKTHNSVSGEPTDTIKYDLYNNKGSYTVEYVPSIDVNTWYVYMASDYVQTDATNISIKVYGEKEGLSESVELPKVKRLELLNFDLASGANKSLSTNYARAKSMTCVDIDANGNFESINLDYDGRANVTIDSSSVINSYDNSSVSHGLTLSSANRICVSFERKTATRLVVKIVADGNVFVSNEISLFVFGGATITNLGSKQIHIASFTYCPTLIDNDIWVLGDSYLSASDPNRWPYWLEQWGHGDVYMDAISGGTSSKMYSSFLVDLDIYTPKYVVWCLGMNNADTGAVNSSWLTNVQNVITRCKERGITVILATIPSVPTRDNSYKNAWVNSSGYRYIDFARAVEDSNNKGYWYSGLLSSDGVHPTESGAKALAMQVLIDFVEITTK